MNNGLRIKDLKNTGLRIKDLKKQAYA